MEERSLKVLSTDKTFFNKIGKTLSKMLIPTKIGINGMLISMKRNSVLKAYENYKNVENTESKKKDELAKRYEESFALYLEAVDKFVMDTVYKKVKNRTATSFEEQALSSYYMITQLKESNFSEYKCRKQKYLLELDYDTIKENSKQKLIDKYTGFYIEKMDGLYKGILKTYSLQLADTATVTINKEDVFSKIFDTLDEYADKIMSLRINYDTDIKNKEFINNEYEKYYQMSIMKSDNRDIIEKKLLLLGISRRLFTHSMPLVVAEQCYVKLLKEVRQLILTSPNDRKKDRAYDTLIEIIDEYNSKILSTKIYWNNATLKENYKNFAKEYKLLDSLKDEDIKEYKKLREILFIFEDLKVLNMENNLNDRLIIKEYKNRLVNYGAMRRFSNNYKSVGNYISNINIKKSYKEIKKNRALNKLNILELGEKIKNVNNKMEIKVNEKVISIDLNDEDESSKKTRVAKLVKTTKKTTRKTTKSKTTRKKIKKEEE